MRKILKSSNFQISIKINTTIQKKAQSFDQAQLPKKVTNQKREAHLKKRFKIQETKKLTTAPIIAKTTVFNTSEETIVGAILNNVPEAVPTDKV
ncbi:hypothetical protein [Flavobacterium columnare]|uniref:hypothetical protein n=1 Tax=Flavobacterium columnare TaxID=996 RepID=UPI003B9F5AE9